jgi:hypothetical protein
MLRPRQPKFASAAAEFFTVRRRRRGGFHDVVLIISKFLLNLSVINDTIISSINK